MCFQVYTPFHSQSVLYPKFLLNLSTPTDTILVRKCYYHVPKLIKEFITTIPIFIPSLSNSFSTLQPDIFLNL